MANDSTKVGDSVSASIMRGLSLGEGPLFSRKQQVFVEKFSGTPLYRLWDGREVSQDFFVNLNPDEVKEIRAKHPYDFDEQLSKMSTGVFVEPVNRAQTILSHNLVVDQGVYAIADAVKQVIEQGAWGDVSGTLYRGTDSNSNITIQLDSATSINSAYSSGVDYLPSGMMYGRLTSGSSPLGNYNTDNGTEMDEGTTNTNVAITAVKTYDSGFPTRTNGAISLKSTFGAPGGSGVTNICTISQNVVISDAASSPVAATDYVENTATSIINLGTLLSLGASDTLAATVTWTIS